MRCDVTRKPVLIVDHHPLAAYAIQRLLSKIDSAITSTVCSNVQAGLEKLRSEDGWYRIFLDPNAPGTSYSSVMSRFCEHGVADRCIVITDLRNPSWIEETRAMGMIGYIVKATPLKTFKRQLDEVLHGHCVFPDLTSSGPAAIRLTRRQHDVLSLLHRGYSSKQVAAQLTISEGTVDNHVAAVLRAFGVTNRTHAIAKAIELGYI